MQDALAACVVETEVIKGQGLRKKKKSFLWKAEKFRKRQPSVIGPSGVMTQSAVMDGNNLKFGYFISAKLLLYQ